MALLPVEDAQARLLGAIGPISETERVDLFKADGRVLAEPLAACLTQPPFNASAMDGYAVRAEDVTRLGSRLRVIGESAAGHGYAEHVGPGECVRIFTGAPVPEGADTVLLQEDAERDGDIMINRFSPEAGRHIRPRGQDFTAGEVVLEAGQKLDPGRIMVAAAMNHATLTVYRRPLIAILATGDELVPPGSDPAANQIIASNTYAIGALAREAGADILDLGIVRDESAAIETAIARASQHGCDALVTVGGASVGDHDLVQSTLKGMGMVLDFWRIAMRPGKPLMVGSLDKMPVLGLPGNPVSSMVCSLLFLEPLIATFGHSALPDRMRNAMTDLPLSANDKRQDYVRATYVSGKDGMLRVRAFSKQDSSQMKIFSRSDCLIVRPPHAPALEAGAPCRILKLRPYPGH